MSDTIDAALRLADAGWPVFPIAPNSKKPYKGSGGLKDATLDPSLIERWPIDSNVAIALPPGILVLDHDPRNGGDETYDQLLADHGVDWQDTVATKTPGGGYHLWYDLQAYPASSVGPSAGIDIRRHGHYVLVPPSKRGSVDYQLVSGSLLDRSAIAPLPDWLPQARRSSSKKGVASQVGPDSGRRVAILKAARERLRLAPEGHRNEHLMAVARFLRRAYNDRLIGEDDALDALSHCPGRTRRSIETTWRLCTISGGLGEYPDSEAARAYLATVHASWSFTGRTAETLRDTWDSVCAKAMALACVELDYSSYDAALWNLRHEQTVQERLADLCAMGAIELVLPHTAVHAARYRLHEKVQPFGHTEPTATTNCVPDPLHFLDRRHEVWTGIPKARRIYYSLSEEPQTVGQLTKNAEVPVRRTLQHWLGKLKAWGLADSLGRDAWVRGQGSLDQALELRRGEEPGETRARMRERHKERRAKRATRGAG
jgi:hypothetical protein